MRFSISIALKQHKFCTETFVCIFISHYTNSLEVVNLFRNIFGMPANDSGHTDNELIIL